MPPNGSKKLEGRENDLAALFVVRPPSKRDRCMPWHQQDPWHEVIQDRLRRLFVVIVVVLLLERCEALRGKLRARKTASAPPGLFPGGLGLQAGFDGEEEDLQEEDGHGQAQRIPWAESYRETLGKP